jgi:hypothetical protein
MAMMRKVMLVISLFVMVDRVMYHKLGQSSQQEKYAQVTLSTSPLHEAAAEKRKMRERLVAHAKAFYSHRVS